MDTSSTDIFPQIVIAVLIAAAIFFIYLTLEQIYRAYLGYGNSRIAVYPFTGSSNKIIKQDPNASGSITLPASDNQLTGIEFSYSTFIYVSDDTDDGDGQMKWKSIFYKGYESSPFPLLGPGVFVSSGQSDGTTLRIIMNTYDKWFNPLDVHQIPMNKWFHLAIVLRSSNLEAYINGNLANKLSLKGTLPYQNYQPLILFPNTKTNGGVSVADSPTSGFNNSSGSGPAFGIPAGESFYVAGKFAGYISNMSYFTYALTYSEIQNQMNIGPSSKFDSSSMDAPPYLIDTWWTQRNT
jgi:hypothetical protein